MSSPGALGRLFAASILVAASCVARAGDDAPVTPEALVYCTVCHGVQLMGNRTLNAPRLSGMSSWYVAAQLHAFRSGWRGAHPEDPVGMEMRPMATGLNDADIAAAAEFASKAVSPRPQPTIGGDPLEGARLYTTCAACHGADGAGEEALGAPALTGHNDWYLARQLGNYVAGYRGYDADDLRGQQMRAAVTPLTSDDDIRAVVAYITTLDAD